MNSKRPIAEVEIKTYKRKKKKGRKQAILDQLPAQEIHHRLDDACHCPDCHQNLKEIGASSVRQEVVFIPATLRKDVHIQYAYKCEQCSLEKESDVMIKSNIPKQPIGNSFGSASIVAETIHQKYELKIPGY